MYNLYIRILINNCLINLVNYMEVLLIKVLQLELHNNYILY